MPAGMHLVELLVVAAAAGAAFAIVLAMSRNKG
jgi:hypothetical protein